MATLTRFWSQIVEISVDVETLKTILMFVAAGLTVSLLVASHGVDTSWAFF